MCKKDEMLVDIVDKCFSGRSTSTRSYGGQIRAISNQLFEKAGLVSKR